MSEHDDIYLRCGSDVPAEAPVQEAEALLSAAAHGYEINTDADNGHDRGWEHRQ